MKEKITFRSLILLLLFYGSIFTMPINSDVPMSDATVALDPVYISDLITGDRFQINVTIEAWNVHCWEFKLYYENIPLNATGVVEGPFLAGAGGGPTIFNLIRLDSRYNATHGIVWANCTLLEQSKNASGSGVLATIFFEAIDTGGSSISLRDTKLYDPSGNMIPHITVTGVVALLGSTTFRTFNVTWNEETYAVATLSNSSVAYVNFIQPQREISYYVNGVDGTLGFCNVTIPMALLRDNATHPWVVLVDGEPVTSIISWNQTHTFIYFTHHHSTSEVQIIGAEVVPEFPTVLIIPLFAILTLLAIISRKLLRNKNELSSVKRVF